MNDETLRSILKNNFILKVVSFKKVEDSETKKLEKVNEEITSVRRSTFLKDLYKTNKIKDVEFVAAAPSEFVFNKIYVRLDGKMVYIFIEAATTAQK